MCKHSKFTLGAVNYVVHKLASFCDDELCTARLGFSEYVDEIGSSHLWDFSLILHANDTIQMVQISYKTFITASLTLFVSVRINPLSFR